jgi:hypothetical protein
MFHVVMPLYKESLGRTRAADSGLTVGNNLACTDLLFNCKKRYGITSITLILCAFSIACHIGVHWL